jgi:hypothetical protein
MQAKGLIAAALVSLGGASLASADVLWSNTGSGVEGIDVFSSAIQSPLIEDGFFADSGAHNITGIKLGYDNTAITPLNADVLITFFDTVDYSIVDNAPIASGQIGSTLRFNFVAAPGAGETSLLDLTGLVIPDNNFGVIVNFVSPNTNIPMAQINHLFKDVPMTIGGSDNFFGYDFDLNAVIDGTEVFQWQDGPFAHANLYMEIQGSAAVPEPATAGLAALGGLGLLRRRRA